MERFLQRIINQNYVLSIIERNIIKDKMVLRKKGERLNRPCWKCGKYYEPTTRAKGLCPKCKGKDKFWKDLIKIQKNAITKDK